MPLNTKLPRLIYFKEKLKIADKNSRTVFQSVSLYLSILFVLNDEISHIVW